MTLLQLQDKLERTPRQISVEQTRTITVKYSVRKPFKVVNFLCSVYVEFGATSTDTVTLTNTYVSSGLTTAKKYNILARQISCTAEWKYELLSVIIYPI